MSRGVSGATLPSCAGSPPSFAIAARCDARAGHTATPSIEAVGAGRVTTLGQLSTYGDTRDEALEQTREAILGYLEAAVEEGISIPRADTETEIVDLEVAAR
jgi:predicted RNase H-like HicB family nuclease